jgi:hypothetical protein
LRVAWLLLPMWFRTCPLLQVCHYYHLVAPYSYLMNYSNSNLLTFPCIYFDDASGAISRLVTSWHKRSNCQWLHQISLSWFWERYNISLQPLKLTTIITLSFWRLPMRDLGWDLLDFIYLFIFSEFVCGLCGSTFNFKLGCFLPTLWLIHGV